MKIYIIFKNNEEEYEKNMKIMMIGQKKFMRARKEQKKDLQNQ